MPDIETFPRADDIDAGATVQLEGSPDAGDDVLVPTAPDVANIFLGGLFILALLGACYVAAEVVLPVVIAFVLMLVLQPVMRLLRRFRLPRGIAAILIIMLFFGASAGIGALLVKPAADWAQKLPDSLPKLEEKLRFLSKPVAAFQRLTQNAESLANVSGQSGPLAVRMAGASLSDRLIEGTRSIMSQLLEVMLVLFFLLIAGDTFLRRLVEVLPSFKDKRRAVQISQQIESDVAAYLLTITLMNAAVGVLTGLAAWTCGLGDPLLWGSVAFLLNYVPILGPVIGMATFLFVGLLSVDSVWLALLPAALYLVIHIVEGETITPMLLARRFTVNPVLVVIALVFWYWMWGVPGAVLATPMLAVTKIICDEIEALKPFGHFIEA